MNAVDTNVLIYAFDESSAPKREHAQRLLTNLPDGVLLWQVCCEFVAACRKTCEPAAYPALAWDRLSEFQAVFPTVYPTRAVLDRASQLMSRYQSQFWDAMIHASCLEAGVRRLYTEDVPGAAIEGLEIVNPFT
jgi:predicted nucleic acid-binding protein